MEAFNNDPQLKADLLKEIVWHREQDLLIKGTYNDVKTCEEEQGVFSRGCAVGCALNSLNRIKGIDGPFNKHVRFDDELGIPSEIAEFIDTIFEGLPHEEAMSWPEKIVEAIPVGADLTSVRIIMKAWVLDEMYSLVQGLDIDNDVKDSILVSNRQAQKGLNAPAGKAAYDAYGAAYSKACEAADKDDSAAYNAYEASSDAAQAAIFHTVDGYLTSAVSAIRASLRANSSDCVAARQTFYKKLSLTLIQVIADQSKER